MSGTRVEQARKRVIVQCRTLLLPEPGPLGLFLRKQLLRPLCAPLGRLLRRLLLPHARLRRPSLLPPLLLLHVPHAVLCFASVSRSAHRAPHRPPCARQGMAPCIDHATCAYALRCATKNRSAARERARLALWCYVRQPGRCTVRRGHAHVLLALPLCKLALVRRALRRWGRLARLCGLWPRCGTPARALLRIRVRPALHTGRT